AHLVQNPQHERNPSVVVTVLDPLPDAASWFAPVEHAAALITNRLSRALGASHVIIASRIRVAKTSWPPVVAAPLRSWPHLVSQSRRYQQPSHWRMTFDVRLSFHLKQCNQTPWPRLQVAARIVATNNLTMNSRPNTGGHLKWMRRRSASGCSTSLSQRLARGSDSDGHRHAEAVAE